MNLVPYNITALAETDVIGGGKNIVAGASFNALKQNGASAQIYSDAAGASPITLPTVVDSHGELKFFIENGDYNFIINGQTYRVYIHTGIRTIESWAAIGSTTVSGAGQIFKLAQHTYQGLGGGDLESFAGSVTDDNVTQKNSATTGFYLKRINYEHITPEMAGVRSDGTTNDDSNLATFISLSSQVEINRPTITGSTLRKYVDISPFGNGSLDVYRKNVVPYVSKNDDIVSFDVIPAKHMIQACSVSKPTVMLIGDSISTYRADNFARSDMLTDRLRQVLDAQFPNGVNFFNRAIAGTGYQSLFGNQSSANIPWYTTNTVNWITDTYNAVLPDLVIIAFGMNDSSILQLGSIKAAIDFYQSRTKVPSIILCTNLVPRAKSVNVSSGTEQAALDGRDYAAGLIRTYAKYRNVGVLDFHRKLCKVQDGFDPVSSTLRTTAAITPTVNAGANVFTAVTPCADFAWKLTFDDSAAGALSGIGILLYFAGGFIQLGRTGGNLNMALYIDSTLVTPVSGSYAASFTNGVTDWIVERRNGYLNIYHPAGSPAFGQYIEPTIYVKIPYPGGETFLPYVSGVGLTNAVFYQGEYVKSKPSLLNIQAWNDETVAQPYGGSGFNHPSNYVGSHVYGPVLEATRFYEAVAQGGYGETTLPFASAITLTGSVNAVVATLSLPAGIWDVSGVIGFIPAATTQVNSLQAGVTTAGTSFGPVGTYQRIGLLGVPNSEVHLASGNVRYNLATTTTLSLTARGEFSVSTLKAYGFLRAQRISS